METFKKTLRLVSYVTALYFFFSAEFVQAAPAGVTAEYKCTSKCNLCLNYPKKTVCSESYEEDSVDYMKAKKLSKFINDGMIVPDEKLKPGYSLDHFSQKYFNCEVMIKKADQLREATQNMCANMPAKASKSTSASNKKVPTMPRMPASSKSKAIDEEEVE